MCWTVLGVCVMSSYDEGEQLAEAIGRDTLEAWRNRGAQCLEELSYDDPEGFLRFCRSVLPDSVRLDLDRGIANG